MSFPPIEGRDCPRPQDREPSHDPVEALAQRLNRERSSEEFGPFFLELDREDARRILKATTPRFEPPWSQCPYVEKCP